MPQQHGKNNECQAKFSNHGVGFSLRNAFKMNERCISPGCQARTDAVSCGLSDSLPGVILRDFSPEGSCAWRLYADQSGFPLYRYCCLTLRIEERHLHDLCGHLLPDNFDGDLHLQFVADL